MDGVQPADSSVPQIKEHIVAIRGPQIKEERILAVLVLQFKVGGVEIQPDRLARGTTVKGWWRASDQ